MDIIIKQGTRVLMPTEYEKLRAAMIPEQMQSSLAKAIAENNQGKINKIQRYQIVCDAMLLSGLRSVEFERMERSWYRGARRVIVLPEGACLKARCEYKERTVMLSVQGCDALERYLNAELGGPLPNKDKTAMRDALRRYAKTAGISDVGITTKMFRKTLVSWLVACFPEQILYIQASMGHTQDTIVQNYIGLGFPKEEIQKMRTNYLSEWGLVR
jgi:integrase